MSAARKIIDKKILRELVPLNTLSQERFEELSGKIAIQEVRAGQYLFRIDDRDNQAVFLLGGEVSLLDRNQGAAGTIIAGADQSRYPIAAAQPRVLSARAAKKCIVARIDASLLEAYLSWDQSNDAEAVVIGADGNQDWMTKMLQSQAFEKIPPATIQKLLLKMDAVQLNAGTTVIRQGEDGDYFYTIQDGKCAVTRRDTPQAEDRLLAELTNGDCFGEEALVSDIKRNATVSMLTDGVLMRLAKEDFVELLQKPLIRYVDYEKAAVMVDEGAVWVDVRSAEEYDNDALEDSVNIPLAAVRGEMPELVFNVSYIICSQTGKSSVSAAFILSHKGFDVYVLKGGLQAVPADASGFVLDDKPLIEPQPGGTSPAPVEAADHGDPGYAAVADTQLAGGPGRGEQQVTTLHAEKLQLESDLSRAHKQIASIERVVDEQKKLHALDKQQIAKTTDENRRLAAAMQDEARRLESLIAEQAEKVDRLQADKQAAVTALDSQMQGWGRERTFLKSEHDEARQLIADLRKQLDQAREEDSGGRPDIRREMEELVSKTNKKIENREFQCEQLKQGQSRLQADLKVMREERDTLEQKLGTAVSEAASRQKDIDSLQAQLASVTAGADEQEQALQLQLESMRLLHEDTKRHAADTRAQFNNMQDELAALKAAAARHRQEEQAVAGGLEAIQNERDVLQQKLGEAADDAASRQQKIATLEAQLASINGDAEEQLQDARLQLETMQQQHEDMERQATENLVQLNSAQDQAASMETAVARLEQEALLHGQQKEELQQALEQRAEQQDSMQSDLEELLLKANDELTRKNDIEGELQGQIDRLRKKLEQTTAELQESREAEQTGIDSIREELHAERSARGLERAEMAARQRELKDQLAAVASEHEENLSNHSDAIERARLQQMRETQLETESQFEELQNELKQSYDEITALEKREKSRLKEEHRSSDERLQQYEAALEQLRTQTEQLQQERDAALMEQRTLLEQINSLRAGDGRISAQDVSVLQGELEEMRKGLEVAERLRAEAETASASMREERDVLQKQVGNNMLLGKPLHAITEQKPQSSGRAEYGVQPAKIRPATAAGKARPAVAGKQFREKSGAAKGKWSRLARVTGLAVVVMAGLVYGLKPFSDRPFAVVSQAQDYIKDLTRTHMPRDEGPGSRQPADRQIVDPGEGAGTSTRANQVPELPPAVPAAPDPTRRPAAAVPAARQHEQAAGDFFSIPLAAPPVAPPEPVVESVPARERLEAAGSFRDTLPDGGVAPLMVKLPAASYLMGSRGNSMNSDEGPQHAVKLPRFAISKYEVTFADYDRFARATGIRLPHDETWGRDDHPAINVSWKDARAYVDWLSAETGHSYRLPSEAQWEFAARADAAQPYPWEPDPGNVPANCFDCGSEWDQTMTSPVGSFPANYFGLHDMGGNVQEWTEDCYRASYDGAAADGSPLQEFGCTQRAVRGGAFTSPVTALRSAGRGQLDQDTRLDNLGFRIVRKY